MPALDPSDFEVCLQAAIYFHFVPQGTSLDAKHFESGLCLFVPTQVVLRCDEHALSLSPFLSLLLAKVGTLCLHVELVFCEMIKSSLYQLPQKRADK